MYITYRCSICGTEFIMPTAHLNKAEIEGRYLACPYGHRDIVVAGRYDDLKDCMQHDYYRKENRAIKQKGWGE